MEAALNRLTGCSVARRTAARRRARWVPWLALPTFLGAGVAGYVEGPVEAGIALGAGLLLVGAAFLITQAALNTARSCLIDRLEASAQHLRQMLTDQVQLDISTLFARFLSVLTPAQEQGRGLCRATRFV